MGLKNTGLTKRKVGERLEFSYEQIHNFISRYNQKQQKAATGTALKNRGRPLKDFVVKERDKINELRNIISKKAAKIKRL